MRGFVAALRFVLVGGFAVLAGLAPAGAKESEEFTVGQWTGYTYTSDDTGQFTDCTVWAFNRNNVEFGVSVKKDWSLDLWLNSKSWNLPTNQSYPISYWIDRNRQYTGRAQTNSEKSVVIVTEYDQDVFNELQNGSQVTFRTQNEDYVFDLSQSRAALNRLLDCVDQYSKQATANPFGGGGEQQPSGGGQTQQPDNNQQQANSNDSSSSRLQTLTVSADEVQQFLVDVTGAKPSMITVKPQVFKSGAPNYYFSTPIGSGQFWQEYIGQQNLRDVVLDYLAGYKDECQGEFEQQMGDLVQGEKGQAAMGVANCSKSSYQNDGAEVMSYAMATTGDVISIFVTYVGGNAAKAKTDNLGKLIARRQESDIK